MVFRKNLKLRRERERLEVTQLSLRGSGLEKLTRALLLRHHCVLGAQALESACRLKGVAVKIISDEALGPGPGTSPLLGKC